MLKNYKRRIFKVFNKYILSKIDILLSPKYDTPFKFPPVFILGAPRSGSTLIYQVITDALDVGYLSNRHCQFYGAPTMAECFFHPTNSKVPSDYTSNFGQTEGYSEPSECGEWWYRFFRREPAYVTLKDVDEIKMHNFRRSLLALTEMADKPIVFKNLYASIRLEAIAKHIPEALFIVIKRNELDNAHSILDGRMKALGCYDHWWSVPPPNVEELKPLQPAQQVVEQIDAVYNLITQAVDNGLIDSKLIFTIQYEEFCNDVHKSLLELENFLLKNELNFSRRFNVPEKFSINQTIRIDNILYSELHNIIGS